MSGIYSYVNFRGQKSRHRKFELGVVQLVSYADLSLHKRYVTEINLKLSETKLSSSLFTSWTSKVTRYINVHIDRHQIPTVTNPKVPEDTFDNLFIFSKHTEGVENRVKGNRILKALSGST